jgi:hypothetical protein
MYDVQGNDCDVQREGALDIAQLKILIAIITIVSSVYMLGSLALSS